MANVEKFKYWCNKILPLVYDDSLSYYEFLGKVYEKLNETIDAVNSNTEAVAEFDQRINDFIAAETEAREGWEDQQERDRQSWEDQQAQKWAAFQAMFISEYDPSDVYVRGDLCSVQYKMYVANASTTGTFDPTKWDEIVLSDYLADYVSTAAAAMQTQYDEFLEDYQRQFGVVQTIGTSTTDAISQDGFTKNGVVDMGFIPDDLTDLKNLSQVGFYRYKKEAATITNFPPVKNNEYGGWIIVYKCGLTNANRSYIVGEQRPRHNQTSRGLYYGVYNSGTSVISWDNLTPNEKITAASIHTPNNITWSNVTTSNGITFSISSKYIASNLIQLPSGYMGLSISAPGDDYEYAAYFYKLNGEVQSRAPVSPTGYNTNDYNVNLNSHVSAAMRVIIKRRDDGDILPTDSTGIKISVTNNFTVPSDIQLDSKKISILGDSLSTFGGSMSDPSNSRYSTGGWTVAGNRCRYPQNNLLFNVTDTYWYKLMQRFNFVFGVNDSWAGSRVSWNGTTESEDVGADKYFGSPTRIGHLDDNGEPDIILVNGGTNDIIHNVTIGTFNYENPQNYTDEQIAALPVNTFADAYRTMIIRLMHTYPDARIICVLPNYCHSLYTPEKADQYNEIIKECCDYFGIKWIDARTAGITIFNHSDYLPDGTHYNAAGMNLLYRAIAAEIEKI